MLRLDLMKIGVFDSGVGGEAVAAELRRLIPNATIITANDHEHVPYGGRPRAEIMKLTRAAVLPLVVSGCDAIVIACNTATTNAIQLLRHDFPHIKFVGLEPMVKPAVALTKTKKIAVLATPATLQSTRYNELKDTFGVGVTFLEPDCTSWAELIEAGRSDEINLAQTLRPLVDAATDVVVLGCTHYHHIKNEIQTFFGKNVTLLEPTDAIKLRLDSLLSETQGF